VVGQELCTSSDSGGGGSGKAALAVTQAAARQCRHPTAALTLGPTRRKCLSPPLSEAAAKQRRAAESILRSLRNEGKGGAARGQPNQGPQAGELPSKLGQLGREQADASSKTTDQLGNQVNDRAVESLLRSLRN